MAFTIRDYVMFPTRPEHFPYNFVRQLQTCSVKPLKVLNWVGPDAYANKFHFITKVAPPNIEDLGAYKGPENISFDTSMSFPMIPLQTLLLIQHHQTFCQYVKNILMSFWMSMLFLIGVEEFSAT